MKEIWTTMASMMGVWAFCQSLLHAIFPPELRVSCLRYFYRLCSSVSSYCYYDITEIDGVNTNELYNAVQLYLSSSASISGTRLSLTRGLNSSTITFGLSSNDCLLDTYKGVTVQWEHVVTQRQPQAFAWRPWPEEKRGFTLRVRKMDKQLVLNSYLDFIMEKAKELRRKNQDRLLYTNSRGGGSLDSRSYPWESVPFKHPSTFDTLAMDPSRKAQIMADLLDFASGESFYQKTGRAWKRGYLLHGPPGTGKSSMIAAMANYLEYDVYDLQLTEVNNNSQLRKLLMKTSSKSIIVIEDIDCSINLANRHKNGRGGGSVNSVARNNSHDVASPPGPNEDEDGMNTITLSGLLNFTDGLWSCCGSERIFVFTTNHIEKLDPALLRSGRMDKHINMSYCSFPALKIMLKNYLGYEESELEREVLDKFEAVIVEAEITPADISEVLTQNQRDKNKAVEGLMETLKKRAEKNRTKSRERNGNEVEDEEQEKRALDNPSQGCDQLQESCSKREEKDAGQTAEDDAKRH